MRSSDQFSLIRLNECIVRFDFDDPSDDASPPELDGLTDESLECVVAWSLSVTCVEYGHLTVCRSTHGLPL